MNRGSLAALDPADFAAHGFNEAPIHESGKSALHRRGRSRADGFNEAPIHESGKSRATSAGAGPAHRLQ